MAARAAAAAEALVAGLVELAPDRSDCDLEDELCAQVGVRLREWEVAPIDEHVNPTCFAAAVLAAAAAAVGAALDELATEPDGWRAPWRVLAAVARIVPSPFSGSAVDAIAHLRELAGGHVLPETPDAPAVTGQVWWTRDVYGSRFGITAPFSTPDGENRWYLWDIDACGHRPFTVHSAYCRTLEQALAQWQAGVGSLAASQTTFTPVDDPLLLAELMAAEDGSFRMGGESADQFAEYHRGMRLAEAAIAAAGSNRAARPADLDATTAAIRFMAWLREHRAGQPELADLEELVTELASSWCFSRPAAVYHTCSPHRVALTVLHVRNYYQEDFATDLVALLPDWISWLAAHNSTPPELAERCRPYALGEPHPDIDRDYTGPNYLARVTE
jgi:hypothetical protein